MPRILILYATREGQAEKIALKIGWHLEKSGLTAEVVNARNLQIADALDLGAYDSLVFGASMHAGGLERELVHFINENAMQIEAKPRSFFLVLLSAATKEAGLRKRSLADALHKVETQISVPFDDVEMIAGALTYSKYPRPLKWLMRRIAKEAGEDTDTSRDYEYTDWEQVERYAQRLVDL